MILLRKFGRMLKNRLLHSEVTFACPVVLQQALYVQGFPFYRFNQMQIKKYLEKNSP